MHVCMYVYMYVCVRIRTRHTLNKVNKPFWMEAGKYLREFVNGTIKVTTVHV